MQLPFHPIINSWFSETYGKPTAVQEEAWPLIAKGEHVLALAPTGSGKTLTGFLAAISRFAEGAYPADELSVLYVSPLKALNEDIRRNLESPLASLRERFEKAGADFPPVRAETRSGDTTQAERRRFRLRPPSILALTPESLAILLVNPRGREILSSVRCLILDEIHTALGTKRGAFLSCQVDRLSLIAGEFQRVALSATVKPPEEAAAFAGGLAKTAGGIYRPRKIHIIAPAAEKKFDFAVEFPEGDLRSLSLSRRQVPESPNSNLFKIEGTEEAGAVKAHERYRLLSEYILERIKKIYSGGRKGTILVFTDSRRRAERLAFILNEAGLADSYFAGRSVAYTHHGSLSMEVRRAVEKALVTGEIPCVVATSSLELGIDIGTVDEVILAGTPYSSSSVLQRVGRAGHGVGLESRGRLFPFHGMDLLQAAAASGALSDKELDETKALENPLDLLAQIVLSLVAEQDRGEDELYETLRGFYAYRNLSRISFDGVVAMLAGTYDGERKRELKKRIYRDEAGKILTAAPGADALLYSSGGVIASRGYYTMRLAATGDEKTGSRIGELDEEFVWERRVGDSFDFGGRSWRINAITSEAVEVAPLKTLAGYAPFYKGDSAFRSPVFSRRMMEILEEKNNSKHLRVPCFSEGALDALGSFLNSQKSLQGKVPLPGKNFIAIEVVDDPSGRGDARLLIYHTFRGGAINYPLSLALAAEFEDSLQMRIDAVSDDNSLLIRLPRLAPGDPAALAENFLLNLARNDLGLKHFMERFESSGVFGAAFREAAERSLTLPRSPFGKRVPLWVIRQKSKWLFDTVSSFRDFPLTAEAWRTSLSDSFDMKGFSALLEEILSGTIKLGVFITSHPSPFSQGLSWAETNTLMYEYDERPDLRGRSPQGKRGGSSLLDELIEESLGRGASRPRLPESLVLSFTSRLMRELPGWAPEDEIGLCEWVKERIAIPCGADNEEWERLLSFVPDSVKESLQNDPSLGGRLVQIQLEGAAVPVMAHREWAKVLKKAPAKKPGGEPVKKLLSQWLRFEGPIPLSRIREVFGFGNEEIEAAATALEEAGDAVRDIYCESSSCEGTSNPPRFYSGGDLFADRENLELLLRLFRRKRREGIKERPASVLIPFLARRQGLLDSHGGFTEKPWDNLCGLSAAAKLWETEIYPARNYGYRPDHLDSEIREGRLIWYGSGKEKCCFCSVEELELCLPPPPGDPFESQGLPDGFFNSQRTFWEIRDALKLENPACEKALWKEAWKGSLSSDSWDPVRRGLQTGFSLSGPALEEEPLQKIGAAPNLRRLPRALKERWRSGPPVRGNWFSLAPEDGGREEGRGEEALALLEEENLNRERVRLLLRRWGVLCRPLLERETAQFSWKNLLPAMRRMELAGELLEGRFFSGINSLQFASPSIDRELEEAETENGLFWMNAADPASPLGINAGGQNAQGIIPGLDSPPSRIASTRLYFKGQAIAAVSLRNGREINFFITENDECLLRLIELIKAPRLRAVQAEVRIVIEKICGKSAAASAYAGALKEAGFSGDRGRLVLW